jgi:hypothetical protein
MNRFCCICDGSCCHTGQHQYCSQHSFGLTASNSAYPYPPTKEDLILAELKEIRKLLEKK